MTATPQRLVKLVPYGNPGDQIFAEIIIGGSDDLSALADFVGWHLERFSVTTDGAGQATVTLSHTPTDVDHVFLMMHEDERVLGIAGLSGDDLTVQKRKLVYDKADVLTDTVQGQPSGVSIAGSLTNTANATATNQNATATNQNTTSTELGTMLTGDAATLSGTGSGNALASGATHSHVHNAHTHTQNPHTHTQNPHAHQIDSIYDHVHGITLTPTSLAPAASESTQLLVLYR